MNKKRLVLNIVLPLFYSVVILILGFVVPRIVMTNYGSDTNGLISTISQIFTYLVLLEAGVGRASRNQLFKPLVSKDQEGVSRVISASKKYYDKVALIYFVIVVALSTGLPFLLKTEVKYWEIFFYILLEGLIGVINFLVSKKWTVLLNADGKAYVVETIQFVSKVLGYISKITLILLHFNIAIVQLGYFVIGILINTIYLLYVKKKYSWVKTNAKVDTKILKDKNSYLINEIAWTIFSSTDMIIISIIISTALSSVYSIYALVFLSINTVLTALYSSVEYVLGSDFQKGKEVYIKTHDLFQSIFIGLIAFLLSVAYLLCLPFIRVYSNGVHDINYIRPLLPLLFSLIQLFSWTRYVSGNLCGLGGYAKQISIISIIEAVINIGLSFLFVFFWSIEGVLLATVCALPLKVISTIYLADIKILKRSPKNTIKIILVNYIAFSLVVLSNHYLKNIINVYDVLSFIKWAFLLTADLLIIFVSINLIVNENLLSAFGLAKYGRKQH